MMRQGIMGIRVRIMLPYDPTGVNGVKTPLSDVVQILAPKDETSVLPVPAIAKMVPQQAAAPAAPVVQQAPVVVQPPAAAAPAY